MRHFACCAILSGYTLFFPQPAHSNPLYSPAPAITVTDTDYYYEPVPGKVVGVWPDTVTVQHLTRLRQQYGFSGVLLVLYAGQYASALQAGFLPANIMIGISGDNYIYAVDTFPAGAYYLDEPAE